MPHQPGQQMTMDLIEKLIVVVWPRTTKWMLKSSGVLAGFRLKLYPRTADATKSDRINESPRRG